jgi:CDP-paratose 2-epimerase
LDRASHSRVESRKKGFNLETEFEVDMKPFGEISAWVTGGAGFVGSNYARSLLDRGCTVAIYDNFARGEGCVENVKWLRNNASSKKLTLIKSPLEDRLGLAKACRDRDLVVHCAAQVSVPLSIAEPRLDYETNATGSFNVLEAVRSSSSNPVVIYTSSNKVYGVPDSPLIESDDHYDFESGCGVDESAPLVGEEPYGVSKAVAERYIDAYARRYGLKAVSFRCSCMYGPHQWGKAEQGWVAWFCVAAILKKTLTLFGDGKQVRDLLYIDDVVKAFDLAFNGNSKIRGEAINLGGGKENAVSLLQTLKYLESATGKRIETKYADWRPGDNKCYYTDVRKAKSLLGWAPEVGWKEGLDRTLDWVRQNLPSVSAIYH